jgi:hypothetical protein
MKETKRAPEAPFHIGEPHEAISIVLAPDLFTVFATTASNTSLPLSWNGRGS